MKLLAVLLCTVALNSALNAETKLPSLHDGSVVSGPGEFRQDGELVIQGKVTLKHMKLALHGPIRVAAGASFELDQVDIVVSDPAGAPNGVSGLRCDGPAHVVVRNSSMVPAGSAHPMWQLRGELQVEGFNTVNSEFHLDHVEAELNHLKIFELEISHESHVRGDDLDLVFLSTHSSANDRLAFSDIPVDRAFNQNLTLGSGAQANVTNTRLQIFLLYLHGSAHAELEQMDRVQLAISPDCTGRLRLSKGRVGTRQHPVIIPEGRESDCPFQLALKDVNVDTWDVYAQGHARLSFEDSEIDELVLGESTSIEVHNSNLYADWLSMSGSAALKVSDSTVGALRLASQRPDLATSQVRVSGHGRAQFTHVTFDCGVTAQDDARVSIDGAVVPPKYLRSSDQADTSGGWSSAKRPSLTECQRCSYR